jgi:DNA mismatch endonuclease (patch repair protein)
MRRIRSKGMKPELTVRKLAHRLGYRYRLHRKDLPGKPDLVFGPLRKLIFVHGCFWHGHDQVACRDSHIPKSNERYWNAKLTRNKERDAAHLVALENAGWQVAVIWECELNDANALQEHIEHFLGLRRDKTARSRS